MDASSLFLNEDSMVANIDFCGLVGRAVVSLTHAIPGSNPIIGQNLIHLLYLKILSRVIKNGKKIGIDFFILPLVDKASIQDLNEEKKLIIGLNNILKKIKGSTRLLLETDYKPSSVLGFVKKFKSFKVGINYDTGNSAALGYNFYDELTYFKFVKNIHIKDRFLNGNTTRLGTGAWNYKKFFLGLKKINYNKNLILQTARSRTGRHLEEIVYSMNFIKKFYV